ncbi:uncharacterized protein LOC132721312 [Ruditapes philippinarum]|uniref:uncharacterized protein LOC132721312 n=1 Tax=Ruditapes philippinarum TaxID=129788 RepID=UPI00295AA291|nr:uncharacterized protein LOC132721312 [Ruditapes philippinarum]
MTETHANIITLLSKPHLNKGRYAVSIDATSKDDPGAIIEKRRDEKLEYIEDHVMTGGGCSPQIELHLNRGKCKIQILISGALKPSAKLEKGEDVLVFNEAQGECRKILSLIPVYDGSEDDTATIKFKVDDEIKHTVHIHEIPTEKSQDLSQSLKSTRSANSSINDASFRTAPESMASSSSSSDFTDESTLMQGSVRQTRVSTSGGESARSNLCADPVPPKDSGLDDAVGGMRLSDNAPGPTVVPQEDPAYDKILLDDSLLALIGGLSPSDASLLLTSLLVPTHIQGQSRFNNSQNIVAANFTSLKHWKSKKTSRKDLPDTTNRQLCEDLITALEGIGRKDIVRLIKLKLQANKALGHDDFSDL